MRLVSILLGAVLAASLAPAGPQAQAAPKPPGGAKEAYGDCKWAEVKGAAWSVWSYGCGADNSGVHLEADDHLPGFVLVSDGPDGRTRSTAIRIFSKRAKAPIGAILEAVRAASPGEHTAHCAFAPWPSAREARGRVALQPTGAAAKAWADSEKTSSMPDKPCGALGVGYDGDRYFKVLPGDPTMVAFYDMGSEVQVFDPSTLRRTKP